MRNVTDKRAIFKKDALKIPVFQNFEEFSKVK